MASSSSARNSHRQASRAVLRHAFAGATKTEAAPITRYTLQLFGLRVSNGATSGHHSENFLVTVPFGTWRLWNIVALL